MEQIPEIEVDYSNLSGYRIGDYICAKKLGQGSFACVYKGFHQKNQDDIVAIKVTNKDNYKGKDPEKYLKLLDAEAKAMTVCHSQHIVKCHKQYKTEKYVIFILEYCNSQSLFDEIQKRGKIPEPEAKRILKQLILAFAQMHKNNIIHRDLKPQNVFKHNQKYKIGDFGFCKIFSSLNDLTRTPLGSMVSMAPQILDASPYGIKADLWSLGTVYYEMLFGFPPYISTTYSGMRRVIQKNQINLKGISKQSYEFFTKVFVADSNQRLSWTQLYSLALFRSPSMIMFQHQDDVDLDDARQTHTVLQQKQNQNRYQNAADHLKQTLMVLPISTIIDLPDQYTKVQESQKNKIRIIQENIDEINKQMQLYKDELNFQLQKSLFIYTEIFLSLNKLDIRNQRKMVEFNFLILTRCFYIMSPLNDALKKETNIFKWKFYKEFLKDSNHRSFLKDFVRHYEDIKKHKDQISDQLYSIEGQKLEQFKDFFRKSIFSRSLYKQQTNCINGIQGKDYTKQQHVAFIVKNYLESIVSSLIKAFGSDKSKLRRIYRALQSFEKIALLEYDKGNGKYILKQAYEHLKLRYEQV